MKRHHFNGKKLKPSFFSGFINPLLCLLCSKCFEFSVYRLIDCHDHVQAIIIDGIRVLVLCSGYISGPVMTTLFYT